MWRRKDHFRIKLPFSAWDYFEGVWVQAVGAPIYFNQIEAPEGTNLPLGLDEDNEELIQGYGPARTLKFLRMPSVTRGLERSEWIFEDVGAEVQDLRVIPHKDLMVIMELKEYVQIHIFSPTT
jgi:hypothetical protein